jgi:hypothetical protein
MPVLARFIRNTPGPSLRDYFSARSVSFPDPVNWDGGNGEILPVVLRVVDAMSDVEREAIRLDAERVDRMTSEVGQTAIMAVATPEQHEALRQADSRYSRALWMFVRDPERFRRAEDVSFFDNARRGRMWDGFEAPAGLHVARDPAHLQALAQEVRGFFKEGEKVKVEIFDRTRPDLDGHLRDLIQVAVYREGLADSVLIFEGEELERFIHRPVSELAFTYEPATGTIEVVAQRKAKREDLARLFAKALLGQAIKGERIPLRYYNLAVFMTEGDFPTDPEDGVELVRPRYVLFESLDGRALVSVEARTEEETVHDVARRLFVEHNPFTSGGYRIREVLLGVRFRPDLMNPRGRTISFRLRHPNGCDLKDKTGKERLLGEKYLRRWGVLEVLSLGA